MSPHLSQLLTRLKQISPMPDDDVVTQEQIDVYEDIIDQIRDGVEDDKDIAVVPALLASLGYPIITNSINRYS